jgi:glycosyltransferase involved in cell wall biosynthesis
MVSVLIPTLNEAVNILDCLESVRWADEIVVVDSGSTDETRELARSAGAQLVEFHWNRQLPKKKNWALEKFRWRNEWVLILDADERITRGLADEITEELAKPRADGYLINRRFMLLGKWIRHCGYSPSWNLRLFRHRLGRYESLPLGDTRSGDNEVHEHVILAGHTRQLRNEMLHFAYPDIHSWVEKHNRYSDWEAAVDVSGSMAEFQVSGEPLRKKRRLKVWSRRLPFRPTLRFFYSYFLKQGFRDGYEGYVLCRLLATYEMLSVFKAREMRAYNRELLRRGTERCGPGATVSQASREC